MAQCYSFEDCSSSISCWQCDDHCEGLGNGDVAGIGALLAFFITAGAAVLGAWLDFLCSEAATSHKAGAKRLDVAFVRGIFGKKAGWSYWPEQWVCINHKVTLLLGDQMIIAGIALLAAGFIQSRTLSTYNFQIIIWQAWLATNCHQAAMVVLRERFQRNKGMVVSRAAAMTILYVMLCAALILGDMSNFKDGYGIAIFSADSAVSCAWEPPITYSPSVDLIASLSILTITHFARISKLFVSSSSWSALWLKEKPSAWLKSQYEKCTRKNRWWDPRSLLLVIVYTHSRAIYDSSESRLFETLWLTLGYVYGCIQILHWRGYAPAEYIDSNWGFGQLLALLSLLVLLMALPDIIAGAYEQTRSSKRAPSPSAYINPNQGISRSMQNPTKSPSPSISANTNVNPRISDSTQSPTHSPSLPHSQPHRGLSRTGIQNRRQRRSQNHRNQRTQLLSNPNHFYKSRCLQCLTALWMLLVFGIYILYIAMTQFDGPTVPTYLYMVFTTGLVFMAFIWMAWFGVAYLCFAI